VLSPVAERRYISLAECIALALENGRLGTTGLRVLAYEPALAATAIEQSLAKFDARLQSSTIWSVVDQPAGTAEQTVLTTSPVGVPQPLFVTQSDNAEVKTSLLKPLATGGAAGITFRNVYQYSNLKAAINPAY
jgi:hypothetical protein